MIAVLVLALICSSVGANTVLDKRSLSTLADLPLDSEGFLEEHLLVLLDEEDGDYGARCAPVTTALDSHWQRMGPHATAYRRLVKAKGDLAKTLGVSPPDGLLVGQDGCGRAVCLERGTPTSSVAHWQQLFKPTKTLDYSSELTDEFLDWTQQACQRADIGWVSYYNEPLTLFWLDPSDRRRIPQGELLHGERHTSWRNSYLGHEFEIVKSANHSDVVGVYPVKYAGFYALGSFEVGPSTPARDQSRQKQIEATLRSEYERSRSVRRTFTADGFSKGNLTRLDPLVWGSIQAYYRNNRAHGAVREEWDYKGLYVNWWESEVLLLTMPVALKNHWHERLRGVVEEWIGGEELELTDIYGIRIYQKGARLLPHVDRFETHAASLIVNVDQGDVAPGDPSWPVEILDLSDTLHEVEMAPGELLYYESARCLHARTQPLASGYYANLFMHYRPLNDPGWFRKENPAHTPAPVTAAAHAAACGTDSPSSSVSSQGGASEGACAAVPGIEVGAAGAPTRPGPLHRASSSNDKNASASSTESVHTAPPGHGHRVHMTPLSGADAIIDYYRATSPKSPAAAESEEASVKG